ncbi:hypothetical protein [Massilia sp. SYSU DXS3249]
MESILWACNLLAVVYLCRWALRADVAETKAEEQRKKMGQG